MQGPDRKGPWLNWQSTGLQNRGLGVQVPPGLPGSGSRSHQTDAVRSMNGNGRATVAVFRKRGGDEEEPSKSTPSSGAGPESAGMNREMRRMMSQREGSAERLRRPPPSQKKVRTSPRLFVKQVRAELGKVAWPTRKEVVTYTVVVVVSVAFFMVIIYGIDFVSLKGVVWLISKGGGK